MDTKWKNSKKVISFLLFFLGVSITFGSLLGLCRNKPSGVHIWQKDKLLEEDYQQSHRFRGYIADRLESFLIMATGGNGLGGIWGYNNGTYYGGGYYGDYYYGDYASEFYDIYRSDYRAILQEATTAETLETTEQPEQEQILSETQPGSSLSLPELANYLYGLEGYLQGLAEINDDYLASLETWDGKAPFQTEDLETYRELLRDYQDDFSNYLDDFSDTLDSLEDRGLSPDISPLTEEQKKKLAQKFHDRIKGDKNLLYTIVYDGEVLYSNSDLLSADGSMTAPEGYNFILYFDGEKVRIQKDGKEVDVYGNGYYSEDSDWYVPGYSNFPTDESVKKAAICIAAAKEPILYMEGNYKDGGSMQYDNTLYWMHYNQQGLRDILISCYVWLGVGILCLALSFLLRKSRREALEQIARFQAKIWVEFKVLFLLAVLLLFYYLFFYLVVESDSALWQEITYAYKYDHNFEAITVLGRNLAEFPALFWLLLFSFWIFYFVWNDLRHNGKIWHYSLTGKLCRLYSAKHMNQGIAKATARRNGLAFVLADIYGLFMLGGILSLCAVSDASPGITFCMILTALLGTIVFLVLQNRIGAKNMETARDMELLSSRIDRIRKGDYKTLHQSGSQNIGKGQEVERQGTEEQKTEVPDRKTKDSAQKHDLEDLLEQLEDISQGMAIAVDEQMKSERMKVELIANVSHDIKTPLTSIISYVEFLKQEEGLPEHVKDYVRILDEKSQRLKNMVQDVFAVSKAASGELPMQMEALDFGKLLRQTIADMEEEIERSPVTFRTRIPDTPVMILADGQRLYRVFQNLFQNAIKYSLEGSRVYVDLRTDGALAMASVKNTSQQELERGRDFAERFTRGDASRTDGGSGLGLSIAQSFTEACGGTFLWETDADLFVVKVSFRILQEAEIPQRTEIIQETDIPPQTDRKS